VRSHILAPPYKTNAFRSKRTVEADTGFGLDELGQDCHALGFGEPGDRDALCLNSETRTLLSLGEDSQVALTDALAHERPRWLRDLLRFVPLKSQFVLSGNVRDLQLCELAPGTVPESSREHARACPLTGSELAAYPAVERVWQRRSRSRWELSMHSYD